MDSKSEDIRPNGKPVRSVDDFDRRILGALTGDARLTYAEIGQIAGLSAPAVHERVRRLKASGVLAGTTIRIDAASVGKPFLAFVHVDADGWGKSQRMMSLVRFPEVEEMHSVAGDTCVILKVRTASAQALEQFLSALCAAWRQSHEEFRCPFDIRGAPGPGYGNFGVAGDTPATGLIAPACWGSGSSRSIRIFCRHGSAVLRSFGNRPIAEQGDLRAIRSRLGANDEESVRTPHGQIAEGLDETPRGHGAGQKCRAGEGHSQTGGCRPKRHM